MRPQSRNDFVTAIVCALPLEFDAVEALFDEHYDELCSTSTYGKQQGDANWYRTGRIGQHDIVLACLPGMGKKGAASATSSLLVSFPRVNLALLVGICGGVPFPSEQEQTELILGDVIISDTVVEYDFGRQYPDGFQRKAAGVKETLGRPNRDMRTFLSGLKTRRMHGHIQDRLLKHLQSLQNNVDNQWQYPGIERDKLFEASYRHKHYHQTADATCICVNCQSSSDPICDEAYKDDCSNLGCTGRLVRRIRLSANNAIPSPSVHLGSVASADTVMKSGEHRDQLAESEKVIGFEMEGAGVWDNLPCIIIKGVCDYADSHKNKMWQAYGAATAASCAKAFLESWSGTTAEIGNPACWLVPFQRNEDFVGRETLLTQLEGGLFADNRFSKMALFALGGMGKTSIAIELAYRVRDKHPTCSVFWITSTSPESFDQSYRKIGQKLRLRGMEDEKTDAKKLVMEYLTEESAGQWFMIFDNADDFNVWFARSDISNTSKSDSAHSRRLADYIPQSNRGCALLTTRTQQVARNFARHSVFEVPEMDTNTSIHLLSKTLGQEEIDIDNESTKQLLEKLYSIPLAIVQAGAYMSMNHITLPDYLSLLEGAEETLVETLSEDFEDNWRYQDQKNPIAATWIVSFAQIQQQNPLAADYLSYMSCIDPKAIPQSFLAPAPAKQQLEAIGCLISYSFLTRQLNDTYDMHRLVHLATRNWLKITQNYERCYGEVLSRYSEIIPFPKTANRSIWRPYLPHIKFTLSLERTHFGVANALLLIYGRCLQKEGRIYEAELPLTEATEASKQILGIEHEDTLLYMSCLATIYLGQGRLEEAKEVSVQVVKTSRRVLGAEHPDTLVSIGDLAKIHHKQGQWKEARKLLLQVIKTNKRVLGTEHPDTLVNMGDLASIYQEQGQLSEAEELFVQVIETSRKVLGTEHPDTLVNMADLALVYRKQGRLGEAEEILIQVIEARKKLLGTEHPDILVDMADLAFVYQRQGQWKEAEELLVQVVKTSKRVLGTEHPHSLIYMGNLVSVYTTQGRWKEAEELSVQIVKPNKKVLGTEHPDTVVNLDELASGYRKQGRWRRLKSYWYKLSR